TVVAEAAVVAVFTVVAVSMGEVSVAVVSMEDVSVVAVSTAVAFVVPILVITDSLMMSSSAASAFRHGGAGTIRTDITVTTITRTLTMDTAGFHHGTTGGGGAGAIGALGIVIALVGGRVMVKVVGSLTDPALAL